MRRLGLAAIVAALLGGGAAPAQTWTGGAGSGSWAAAGNWSGGVPASSPTTAVVLAGTTQTVTVQDIAAAFQLNSLSMDAGSATNGFTVNPSAGSRLVFAGSSPTVTYTGAGVSTASFLQLNTDLEVGTAGLTLFVSGPTQNAAVPYETVIGGRLLGSGTITRTYTGVVGTDLLLRGAGGTFSGTFTNGSATGGNTFLAARDVFGRSAAVNVGTDFQGINLSVSAGLAQLGLAAPTAYSQQIGTLTGTGQVLLSNATLAGGGATLLAGFSNAAGGFGTLSAPAPAGGPAVHFGKVGTGTYTLTGSSTAVVGGVSVRDGGLSVSGVGATLGSTAVSPTTALTYAVYGGATLQTVTGTGTASRLQNNAAVALSGGTLRVDGSGLGASATGFAEAVGPLTLGAGQSVVRVDAPAGRGVALQFAGLTTGATGTLLVESDSLGLTDGNGVGAENVGFATAPTLVGTTATYGLATTNLAVLPAGASGLPGLTAPTTFVTYDAVNGSLRALAATNYAALLGTADANVSLSTPATVAAATVANSLRLTAGGSAEVSASLTLTSGALLSNGGGNLTGGGALNFGAGGSATGYVSSTGALSVGTPVAAANLVKGGAGTLSLDGPTVALGNAGVLAVNAGTVAVSAATTVTAANGALAYQVARGATLNLTNAPAAARTIAAGQLLTGAGTVTGTVTVSGTVGTPGVVAPSALGGPTTAGAAPGTLTVGSMAWAPNGAYRWYINSVQSGPYSQSTLSGAAGASLDLTGLSTANRFTVTPHSLALSNADGAVYDFDRSQSYTWTLATFPGGVPGFSPDLFTVSVAEFSNALQAGDAFTVQLNGNDVQLVFTPVPVPEPLCGLALAAVALGIRRRLRRA